MHFRNVNNSRHFSQDQTVYPKADKTKENVSYSSVGRERNTVIRHIGKNEEQNYSKCMVSINDYQIITTFWGFKHMYIE